MDDYIAKPIDANALRQVIERWTVGTTAADADKRLPAVETSTDASGNDERCIDLPRLQQRYPHAVARKILGIFLDDANQERIGIRDDHSRTETSRRLPSAPTH